MVTLRSSQDWIVYNLKNRSIAMISKLIKLSKIQTLAIVTNATSGLDYVDFDKFVDCTYTPREYICTTTTM